MTSARLVGGCILCLCLVLSLLTWQPRLINPPRGAGEIDWTANQGGRWQQAYQRNHIGSKAWLDRYPAYLHGPRPKADWIARYELAKAQGLIANVPQAELVGGLARYPEELDMNSKVCSYRVNGCLAKDDVVDGPHGTWAINFDDGPLPPSAELHRFLDTERQHATHFWVGHNVKQNWPLAVEAAKRGDHLAVHTWSHPHLTTYTDEEIIGELGWTMQIIYDVSGYIPKYMRPPFGDTDARVRSIAKHVFGLVTVIWNDDSEDWALSQIHAVGDFIDPPFDGATVAHSTHRLTSRMNGTHDIGVIVLEHELSKESIAAFIDSYPVLHERRWKTGCLADVLGREWYQ